jgi:hypothetical protein
LDVLFCFVATDQPKFDRSHETVSVVVGKRALLPCYVSIQEANNNGNSPSKVIIFLQRKKEKNHRDYYRLYG